MAEEKGYKAFHPGMICNGKQYAENTDFEEAGADKCCQAGVMHYCKDPLDVWDYYPVVDDNVDFTEYAEVEALSDVLVDGNKRACKKIHVGAKLSFRDFIKAAVDVVIESTRDKGIEKRQIGSSGHMAKIGSSGDRAKIGSSGDRAKIGSSGHGAQIGSSGDMAKIGSSGDMAKINIRGRRSVGASVGDGGSIKGALNNWIVLAEWADVDGEYTPVCVKAAQIDGEKLKPDVWYMLKNGEFVEVEE